MTVIVAPLCRASVILTLATMKIRIATMHFELQEGGGGRIREHVNGGMFFSVPCLLKCEKIKWSCLRKF